MDAEEGRRRLRELGLGRGPYVVLALRDTTAACTDPLHDEGIAHLTTSGRERRLVLVAANRLSRALAALGDTTGVGVSAKVHALGGVPDAARQARWALGVADDEGGSIRYTSAQPLFGPRTVAEAQTGLHQVLGPLIDHDRGHATHLVDTLAAYLECDRSWKAAAERLGVHHQTLGSRLARIEQLTGRRVSSSADIAECWWALRARALEE